jgi:hypothetical protein
MRNNHHMRSTRLLLPVLAVVVLASACTDSPPVSDPAAVVDEEGVRADRNGCADVIDVVVADEGSSTHRFDVTVRSADTGEEKYADLWEVRAPDGTVLGRRVLTHPHVEEQPFTRSQGGISIPDTVTVVIVVARDTVGGFCGEPFEISIP